MKIYVYFYLLIFIIWKFFDFILGGRLGIFFRVMNISMIVSGISSFVRLVN